MSTGISAEDLNGLVSSLSESSGDNSQIEPEDELPEKYRGKSVAEIVEMHRNAEREIGRLGNSLGEQRELVNVLASKIETKRRRDLGEDDDDAEPVRLTPEALLDNPEAILEKWLRSKTKKRADNDDGSERVAQLERHITLASKHPDYVEVSNSPEFVEWVKESPLRLMTAQAGAAGNSQAAIAVLDEYKQSRRKGKSDDPNIPSLEKGTGDSPEPGLSRKPKYSRRAIRALAANNRAKYEELLPKIRAAYERGEVVDDV